MLVCGELEMPSVATSVDGCFSGAVFLNVFLYTYLANLLGVCNTDSEGTGAIVKTGATYYF